MFCKKRSTMITYHIMWSTMFKAISLSAYSHKFFSILINFENLPPTRPFPFNGSRLNKHFPGRRLKEWETSKIVFYKVLKHQNYFSRWIAETEKKKPSNCKCIIIFEMWKVVINKLTILPKLTKELGQVEFSFKKWGVPVHKR